jgi:hypothetical protein
VAKPEDEVDEAHRSDWARAGSLLELGELMARWLEGEITYQPGYFGAALDSETTELVPLLAAVNRASFVTYFSQPALPFDGKVGRRAAVSGFCSEDMTSFLMSLTLGTELVVIRFPPGVEVGGHVVVTIDDGDECAWVGCPEGPESIEDLYAEDLSAEGLASLHAAWQVHVLDPRWGRKHLMERLLRLVGDVSR